MDKKDITGRDAFVCTEAYRYAYNVVRSLPKAKQPWWCNDDASALMTAEILCYAIAAIDARAETERASSDRDDMVAILMAITDELTREEIAERVRRAIGILPDLTDWKRGGAMND